MHLRVSDLKIVVLIFIIILDCTEKLTIVFIDDKNNCAKKTEQSFKQIKKGSGQLLCELNNLRIFFKGKVKGKVL